MPPKDASIPPWRKDREARGSPRLLPSPNACQVRRMTNGTGRASWHKESMSRRLPTGSGLERFDIARLAQHLVDLVEMHFLFDDQFAGIFLYQH